MTISRILTIEQVAELLNVKTSWLYQRTADGSARGMGRGRRGSGKASQSRPERDEEPLPHFKAGKLLRFDEAEVLAWFSRMHRNGDRPSVTESEDGEKRAVNQ